jgi:hypothetical protein
MQRKVWKRALVALCVGTVCQFGIGGGACINALAQTIPIGMGFTLGADITESLGLGSLLPGIGNPPE